MQKSSLTSAAVAAVAAISVFGGGAAIAAGSGSSSTAGTAPSSSSTAGAPGTQAKPPAPHKHTAVTGAEKTKVEAAVKAKYSGITITEVRMDPDKSYDVVATKGSDRVMYEVSADLKTITERTGGPGGGPGGHGGPGASPDTAVTGAEKTKVEAAVKAKYSGITITEVRMDPDKSYDVVATKGSDRVMYEVSADLKTITERTGGPGGGPGGHGGPRPGGPGGPAGPADQGSGSSSSSSSTATSGTATPSAT